jgi:hypothetical protein
LTRIKFKNNFEMNRGEKDGEAFVETADGFSAGGFAGGHGTELVR